MDKPAQWALVGAAWFLALSVAVIGFLAWRHFETQAVAAQLVLTVAQGSATPLPLGAQAICPVTKEHLIIAADTPTLVYKERYYYFSKGLDSAGHEAKRLFLLDPEYYANPGTLPLAERIAAQNALLPEPTAVPTPLPTVAPTPFPTRAPLFPTVVPPVPTATPTPGAASLTPEPTRFPSFPKPPKQFDQP
jgi:hypothetical protein